MAGMTSHGPNGPKRPVRGREVRMDWRRDCCLGVTIWPGWGPV